MSWVFGSKDTRKSRWYHDQTKNENETGINVNGLYIAM